MDAGAWWAAVYGVAQSRIRLKRLSSSSIEVRNFLETLYLEAFLRDNELRMLGANRIWEDK